MHSSLYSISSYAADNIASNLTIFVKYFYISIILHLHLNLLLPLKHF